MARHCAGRVVYFSMSTEKGEEGFDRVDGHVGRGGAAFCLQQTPRRRAAWCCGWPARTMPLLYTHLIPATFGGRARMNVANALAAAAAAWAAGAHLHDIRQGLRTFSTSFFQAPGRLNVLDVRRRPGHHRLLPQRRRDAAAGRLRGPDDGRRRRRGRTAAPAARRRASAGAERAGAHGRPARRVARSGVIGIPGDRRDDDQREYGALAAAAFDEIIVREDKNLRGRPRRARAPTNVIEGIKAPAAAGRARTARSEKILEELAAVRAMLRRATRGRSRRDVRRRRRGRLPRGDGLGAPAGPAPRSPIRAS